MRRFIPFAVLGLAAQAGAVDCSNEAPCTLAVVVAARERVAKENAMAARMANAPANEHNINVGDQYFDLLRKWVDLEKEHFAKWCEATASLNRDLQAKGAAVTSENLFKYTGKPDREDKLERGPVEARLWSWDATGPFSLSVVFGVTFTRPKGSTGPWGFLGCTWCASGSLVTTQGCTELPWKP
jgi:hypothetical protein